MPIYVFRCKNKKCDAGVFEHLCKYEEIAQTRCPACNTKRVEQQLSTFNVAFTMPHESSKWDSFDYRAGYNMEKAKDLRRKAEETSHVGPTPYSNRINDLTKGEGILR